MGAAHDIYCINSKQILLSSLTDDSIDQVNQNILMQPTTVQED
jgi:hypothetical protein